MSPCRLCTVHTHTHAPFAEMISRRRCNRKHFTYKRTNKRMKIQCEASNWFSPALSIIGIAIHVHIQALEHIRKKVINPNLSLSRLRLMEPRFVMKNYTIWPYALSVWIDIRVLYSHQPNRYRLGCQNQIKAKLCLEGFIHFWVYVLRMYRCIMWAQKCH